MSRGVAPLFCCCSPGEVVKIHKVENHAIPGPELGRSVPVRIYEGAPSIEPRPGLLFLHGGGWWGGSLAMTDNICRRLALASGRGKNSEN